MVVPILFGRTAPSRGKKQKTDNLQITIQSQAAQNEPSQQRISSPVKDTVERKNAKRSSSPSISSRASSRSKSPESLRIGKAVTEQERVNALLFIGREHNHSPSKIKKRVTGFMDRIETDKDVTIVHAYRRGDETKTPVAAWTAFHLPDNRGAYVGNVTISSNWHRSEPAIDDFRHTTIVPEQCPRPTLFHSSEKIDPAKLQELDIECLNSSKDLPSDLLSKLKDTVKLPNERGLYLYVKR